MVAGHMVSVMCCCVGAFWLIEFRYRDGRVRRRYATAERTQRWLALAKRRIARW